MNNKIIEQFEKIKHVDNDGYKIKSSYINEDCIFLLKDISNNVKEISINEKEKLISSGVNYSEMMSREENISNDLKSLFISLLKENSRNIAYYVGKIAESIYKKKGKSLIIVSLARAGTPFGILIKDYLKLRYNVEIPHYSISIIRGKGFDENAIVYILAKHPDANIQFVDGWTGKGSITFELKKSVKAFEDKYSVKIDDGLAVVADPAKLSMIYGTRRDILIPNCCLNSTISGLVSRTYHSDIIKDNDFHGAKVFWNLKEEDYSYYFLEKIRNELFTVENEEQYIESINYGEHIINQIAKEFNVKDLNKIKLSIGETSRVLLRRNARIILIKNIKNPDLAHIIKMAEEKHVELKHYDKSDYECISIIND